jgi:hypothetical protein
MNFPAIGTGIFLWRVHSESNMMVLNSLACWELLVINRGIKMTLTYCRLLTISIENCCEPALSSGLSITAGAAILRMHIIAAILTG